jgi:hypothetical protein
MSACDSYSRLYLRNAAPRPNWVPLRDDRTGGAADDCAGDLTEDRPDLELLAFGRLCGSVTQSNVRQLVRHHTSDLTLGLRGLDHSSVEEHRSARKSEGVDLFLVHHVEGVPEFRNVETPAG